MTVFLTCLLIALARVVDITLDTVRTVAIVQGRRTFASFLGFFEALVYLIAVAKVLANLSNYWYAIAYAGGFAAGTYLGIVVEQALAFGEQLVAVFTRRGAAMVASLRADGLRVTEFTGRGRDGEVRSLFIQVARRSAPELTRRCREVDPNCFYVIHDVRAASKAGGAPLAGIDPAGEGTGQSKRAA